MIELNEEFSILYVEDEEHTRESLSSLLIDEYNSVYVAKNGEEGLELFEKYAPDIIITDIQMPKMNGLDMVEIIRDRGFKTPVIVTTAFNDKDYFLTAINLKVDRYISKPIDVDVLLDEIEGCKKNIFQDKKVEVQNRFIKFSLDSNPNFIFTISKINKKISYINKTFLNSLGFNEYEEFSDKSLFDFIYKIDDKELNSIDEFLEYIAKENRDEFIIYIKDKIYKLFITQFEDLKEGIFTLTDITKLKNENLELKDMALKQQKILELQSRQAQIGEMLNSIIHQWKQPLSAISLINFNLSYDIKNEKNLLDKEIYLESINSIDRQIKFMNNTMENFRNFFRQSLEKQQFDIKSAIEKTLELVGSEFKKYYMEIIVSGDNFTLNGYENLFQQVILNLLSNSKDAILTLISKDKNFIGKIDIILSERDKSISIIDNGGGIKDDIINKIFEPYFSTKRDIGTGIGLYMSKNIIDSLGGNIKAKNFKDGTLFNISFNL